MYEKMIDFTEGGLSNVYVYSRNRSLLDMSIEQLRENTNLKFRYMQVDSQQRCVPSDWYMIGYDTFATHTFLRLIRGADQMQGFMKPFFPRSNPNHNFIVNYSTDFDMPKGLLSYLRFKFWISLKSLLELFGLLAVIKTISSLLQKLIMEIYKQSRASTGGIVFSFTTF